MNPYLLLLTSILSIVPTPRNEETRPIMLLRMIRATKGLIETAALLRMMDT
jgi:hypothetical protein